MLGVSSAGRGENYGDVQAVLQSLACGWAARPGTIGPRSPGTVCAGGNSSQGVHGLRQGRLSGTGE